MNGKVSKVQLALAVLKGRREELKKLEEYIDELYDEPLVLFYKNRIREIDQEIQEIQNPIKRKVEA